VQQQNVAQYYSNYKSCVNILFLLYFSRIPTFSQETEWVYFYSPEAHAGDQKTDALIEL